LTRKLLPTRYRFIDGVLTLPKALEITDNDHIHEMKKERNVAYMSTAEKIGMKKGEQTASHMLLFAQFRHAPLPWPVTKHPWKKRIARPPDPESLDRQSSNCQNPRGGFSAALSANRPPSMLGSFPVEEGND